MRAVSRMSAIVAALSILAAGALTGCGQRGPLYLPTVPPLPPKPQQQTQPPSPEDVKPSPETASSSIPDTSGEPFALSPDDTMQTPASGTATPMPQRPASDVPQAQ
ncbi:LPS translocon maturation chaperone LptM [Paraburkholderia rhizosphaerae]|uniref:Putative lipoprotein n=1 Tax=Paraburkholderia rhizosphaerae TaxID=480658 RepID=A0A4R8LB38_9BURK|nr:lipoprotein [Paraburkholderia rhizosphaerae]TDY40126.1 putative lipoprotein [Paraburkholderia rhizosphaerae]